MLESLELRGAGSPWAVSRASAGLQGAFPGLPVEAARQPLSTLGPRISVADHTVIVTASAWRARAFDPITVDEAVACAVAGTGSFRLRLEDEPVGRGDLFLTALQLVTRCQRHLAARNRHSAHKLFDAIIARHRALHDLTRPLVAADYDHALDTWRWVLRREPHASLALQVAALFHDVERLVSEPEVRIEQHAPDYAAFKRAHAAAGARMTAEALAEVGAPRSLVERVAALVAGHESPDDDPDRAVLNEADALSFFSLNAPGFARHYGPEHTAKKVRYTVRRLGASGRQALAGIRHRADIAALIEAELRGEGA
jgi:hypothetical protein